MQVLGVIAARGGSKGIPRKNLAMLGGRSLLAWTCEAALGSRQLTRVVLSTDDDEIAAAGAACGVLSPYRRPAELASDDAPIVDVLVELLSSLRQRENYRPAALALLQPTSPFRTAAHIDAVITLLEQSDAETVVTVVRVPHQFNPVSVLKMNGNRVTPFLDGPTITRRQDKPAVFARNGPAVLVTRAEVVESGRLYGDNVRAVEMRPDESIDIDDPGDLELANCLFAKKINVRDGQ